MWEDEGEGCFGQQEDMGHHSLGWRTEKGRRSDMDRVTLRWLWEPQVEMVTGTLGI